MQGNQRNKGINDLIAMLPRWLMSDFTLLKRSESRITNHLHFLVPPLCRMQTLRGLQQLISCTCSWAELNFPSLLFLSALKIRKCHPGLHVCRSESERESEATKEQSDGFKESGEHGTQHALVKKHPWMKKPSVSNVPADFLPKTLDAISRCTIDGLEQRLPRILKTKLLANVAVRVLTHWTYYRYSGSDFTTREAKLGCTILNIPAHNCRIYTSVFKSFRQRV